MQDVSKILTRKYYGKKDPFRSREFRQPRWMELLAVLLFTVSGLGEGKSINVVLGGLPKAVTLAFVGLAGLEFFIRGDFDRLKKLAGPSGLYILYLAVLAAWSMFIWVRNFTAFASITRGVEKILYQSIATVWPSAACTCTGGSASTCSPSASAAQTSSSCSARCPPMVWARA